MEITAKIITIFFACILAILAFVGIYNKYSDKDLDFWFLLALFLVATIIYILTATRKKVLETLTKDEVDKIDKKRDIYSGKAGGMYNHSGELDYLPNTVRESDVRLWTPTGTADLFMISEKHYYNPLTYDEPQIKLNIVQLTSDKKLIEGGNYTMHEHTDFMDWTTRKSYTKKLPFTNPESENLKLAQLAIEGGGDIEQVLRLRKPEQQDQLIQPQTNIPTQQQEGEEKLTPDEEDTSWLSRYRQRYKKKR